VVQLYEPKSIRLESNDYKSFKNKIKEDIESIYSTPLRKLSPPKVLRKLTPPLETPTRVSNRSLKKIEKRIEEKYLHRQYEKYHLHRHYD
jgi:hypothetical protein